MTDPAIPPETLGDRMRRALRKERMSVQDMADYLGVSRNTVGTWLNDHITPSEQTFKLWAIRTGVPLEWLKEGRERPFSGGLGDGPVTCENPHLRLVTGQTPAPVTVTAWGLAA